MYHRVNLPLSPFLSLAPSFPCLFVLLFSLFLSYDAPRGLKTGYLRPSALASRSFPSFERKRNKEFPLGSPVTRSAPFRCSSLWTWALITSAIFLRTPTKKGRGCGLPLSQAPYLQRVGKSILRWLKNFSKRLRFVYRNVNWTAKGNARMLLTCPNQKQY